MLTNKKKSVRPPPPHLPPCIAHPHFALSYSALPRPVTLHPLTLCLLTLCCGQVMDLTRLGYRELGVDAMEEALTLWRATCEDINADALLSIDNETSWIARAAGERPGGPAFFSAVHR
jgi:hypothetical protein